MRPLLAGIGLAPASAAYAASLRQRPGWDQDTIAWCGADRAHAAFGQQLRSQVGDQVGEVALVIGELSVDPADGESEAAGLGAPDRVFAGLVLTAAAARDGSEPVGGQRAAGQRSVGVAAGEQQRAQTIDRPSLGCGELRAVWAEVVDEEGGGASPRRRVGSDLQQVRC